MSWSGERASHVHWSSSAKSGPPNDPPQQPPARRPPPRWLHMLWLAGLVLTVLLREAERRALALLTEHRVALDRLVEDLLAHETVDSDAVDAALQGSGGATGPAESGGPLRTPQYQARSTPPTS